MNTQPASHKIDIAKIKKNLVIATIVLISICAFLGIVMIFVGSSLTVMRVMSTLLIMYLVLLCSTNNFVRTESPVAIVRGLSFAALVVNFIWSIPWILLVWDAFDGLGSQAIEIIWKIVGSGMVISAFCTFLASKVVKIINYPTVIKFFKSLPLVCAGFIGLDLLLIIWIDDMDTEIVWKLILSELILLLLQWIITQILMHNAGRLGINLGSTTPGATDQNSANSNSSTTASASSQPNNNQGAIVTETDGQSSTAQSADVSDSTAATSQLPPSRQPDSTLNTIFKVAGVLFLLSLALPLLTSLLSLLIGLLNGRY